MIVGIVASKRGRFGYGWFLLSVIVTPIVTGAVLLLLPCRPMVATTPLKSVNTQTPDGADRLEITASPKLRLIFVVIAGAMLVL